MINQFSHGAVVQDGRCEHGNVGGAVQQFKTCAVCAQLEILPIWVHRGLLHCTLPISKTDDMHVGQIAISRKTPVLQHEMTMKQDSVHHTNFVVIVYLCKYSSQVKSNGDIHDPFPNSFIISPFPPFVPHSSLYTLGDMRGTMLLFRDRQNIYKQFIL